MAAERGAPAEALIEEAIERLLDHEEWFLREVDKGLAAADRGEFVEHDHIRRLIDTRYPG
jgi:predicted transcriptional regulator